MNPLFSPIKLKGLTLPNRIVVPPMDQYSADEGRPVQWHAMHYGTLAVSGAGLLIVEATAVEAPGRISPQDLGLWNEEQEAAHKAMLDSIRSYSSTPIGIQLGHAGRKGATGRPWEGGKPLMPADGGWEICAPSALPYAPGHQKPAELTAADIARLTESFVTAAKRAVRAGYDAIELHAAHGYLMHEFLSPLSNARTDAYGGWNVEECVVFARAVEKAGGAYIHVSGGGLSPDQKITLAPGYQVALAAAVKAAVSELPVIAVGLITEPELASSIVVTGQADMVAIGRAMLYDPRWPWHAAAVLGQTIAGPSPYLRSKPHNVKDLFV